MGKRLPVLSSHEDASLCGPCGGRCCQQMPGSALPADFGAGTPAFAQRIESALASGRWAVDWWEGDPRVEKGSALSPLEMMFASSYMEAHYLRPATAGMEGEVFDPSYGGRCTFHSERGCGIFPSRPSGCRGLKPMPLEVRQLQGCSVEYGSKREAAIAWLPYEKILLQAACAVERRGARHYVDRDESHPRQPPAHSPEPTQ